MLLASYLFVIIVISNILYAQDEVLEAQGINNDTEIVDILELKPRNQSESIGYQVEPRPLPYQSMPEQQSKQTDLQFSWTSALFGGASVAAVCAGGIILHAYHERDSFDSRINNFIKDLKQERAKLWHQAKTKAGTNNSSDDTQWETLNISPMVIGSFFNGYFSLVDKTNSEVIISNISKLCNSVSVNCPKRFTPSWESIRTYLRDNIRLSIQKQMQETDTQFQNLIDCPTENSDVIYPKVFQRAIPFWHSHYGL